MRPILRNYVDCFVARDWEAVGDKCAELGLDLKWQAQRRTGILASNAGAAG
jgi:hypothetical protein